MQVLDVSNLTSVGRLAKQIGASIEDIDHAGDALGVIASMIDGIVYIDKCSCERIRLYLAAGKREQTEKTPETLN